MSVDFDIGSDILNTELDSATGSISLQIGNALINPPKAVTSEVEMWGIIGIASRPAKAVPGKDAAQGIFINLPDQDICLATRDVRDQKIYGSLNYGETVVYAAGPNNTGTARSLYKDDGTKSSITHMIQDGNSNSGSPILMQLSSDGKIIMTSSAGGISLDSGGLSLVSNGTINIGASGAVAIIGSTMALNAGSVTVGAGADKSVAIAPPLQEWAANVTAAINALATAVATKSVVNGSPVETGVGSYSSMAGLSDSVASGSVKVAG